MYLSKYSNGKYVSPAQYITETICEHKAKKDGKDLHYRFWTSKEWEKFFRNQIGSANKLLKEYSDKAIVAALKTDTGKRIFSLRAPHLKEIIEQQQRIIESQNSDFTQDINRKSNKTRRDHTRKNILSTLEDIDNDNSN